MSYQVDDSIREDYLNEAGELVADLSEQLIELEQRPDDRELLDSVFRAFHTVKGGAGFLNMTALVDCCHCAEEVFDALRRKEKRLDAEIMDAILQALDTVNAMLEAMRQGQEPVPASESLLEALRNFVEAPSDSSATAVPDSAPEPVAESGDVTDDEFEAMLAEAIESDESSGKNEAPDSDEISDDEFEALLDQLQGSGSSASAKPPKAAEPTPPPPAPSAPSASAPAKPAADKDLPAFSETEFASLLQQLPTDNAPARSSAPTASSQPASQPAARAVPASSSAPAETSVRVDVSRLDTVMNLVGELVLVRNRLMNIAAQSKNEELQNAVDNLDLVTADLQSGVMQTRMQPIRKVFSRFPRLSRDLARSLKKEIDLTMSGEDTDLDKNLVEALADPLVHLVRNAMDHGVEAPDVREAKGKSRVGHVHLAAEQEGDHIVITIRDDGAGINIETLRNKAVQKGLLSPEAAAKLDRHECFDLIFLPGLSSRDQVSDISGRGVGMDVVKTRISELNGTVSIDSEIDRGTEFKVKLPLTLAILPALMVQLGERRYAFPLSHVVEVFFLQNESVRRVEGRDVVMVRGKPLPLVFLDRLLGIETLSKDDEEAYVVVVQMGNDAIGFVTNDVLGQEEVVIKPLGALLQGLTSFAGATITGDGHIALIMDVNGLMNQAHRARQG